MDVAQKRNSLTQTVVLLSDRCLADMFNKDSKPHGDMEAVNKEEVEKLRSHAQQSFDRCHSELV